MKRSRPRRILYASHWWLEELMGAVAHYAAEYGWHMSFEMCLTGKLPSALDGDGIITTFSGDPDKMKRFLAAARCPAVSLNQNYPEIDIPRVDIDMQVVGRLAAGHFLERGFRSFAVYTPHTCHATRLGFASFAEAVGKAGYTVHELYWPRKRGGTRDSWPSRQHWLQRRLRQLPKPVAVLATEAECPVEVIEACMEEGLAIPDEVAVLGLLDMPVFRQCTTVPLSSITADFDTQARKACDLLHRLMEGEPPPAEPILIPPTGIVIRRSTDTIAAATPQVAKAIRFMLDHYAEPIGVPDAVRISGLSRTGLFNAFEADVGESPGALLARIRIDKARRMLGETSEKIRTISETCGFGASINLQRHFKQRLGISPAAYREQNRAQAAALAARPAHPRVKEGSCDSPDRPHLLG